MERTLQTAFPSKRLPCPPLTEAPDLDLSIELLHALPPGHSGTVSLLFQRVKAQLSALPLWPSEWFKLAFSLMSSRGQHSLSIIVFIAFRIELPLAWVALAFSLLIMG